MARARKSSSGNRKGNGDSFWWAVLILLLVGIGAWFWSSQDRKVKGEKPRKIVPLLTPVTNAIKIQTNAILTNAPTTSNRLTHPATNPIVAIPVTPLLPLVQTSAPQTSAPTPAQFSSGVYPRPPRDVFEAQVALAKFGVSPGSIDGSIGSQTRAALAAFQSKFGLMATGELDTATRNLLTLHNAPITSYIITSNDLARLQPVATTWLGKSQQTALDYENILELIAERSHGSPNLIRRLNPNLNWSNVVAGMHVSIPRAEYPKAPAKAAFIVISLAQKHLKAYDSGTNLIAHFPCSIAARFDKRPAGELHVTKTAEAPDYTFNPEVFPESEEARRLGRKLILPPGPNNPVGTAWIGLDKPGYGIHGTPNPEQVGRTESRGCFRLANWNANYLVKMVWNGLPVRVVP